MAGIQLRALLIEDNKDDADLLLQVLKESGYDVIHQRVETREYLKSAITQKPWHIVFSDYSLPSFTGVEALAIVRESKLDVPFILVSGTVGEDQAVEAMRAGAQDYLMKDNLKRLGAAVARELTEANRRRDQRLRETELAQAEDRLRSFKRFFSPQIAELIVSNKIDDPFQLHRKDVSVLFVDLRGFTRLAENSEPVKVMAILQDYYAAIAKIVQPYHGSVGHVAGDGVMVFFNAPINTPRHPEKAVLFALELREHLRALCAKWSKSAKGEFGFGMGMATGSATIGGMGVEGCWDYSIIGTVANLASRLCDEALNGEIIVPKSFVNVIQEIVEVDQGRNLKIRGLADPVQAFNVLKSKATA